MMIIQPLAALLLVSSWGIAHADPKPPIPNPGCRCSGKYHKISITAAIRKALDGGARDYPRVFKNDEKFKFSFNDACNDPEARLFEYPLVKKHPYTGGAPGFERVIYIKVSDGVVNAQYCGCIVHPAGGNTFKQCQDSEGKAKETKAGKKTNAKKKTKAGSSSTGSGSVHVQ